MVPLRPAVPLPPRLVSRPPVDMLGILNIGLVSLRERVEEIELRRATGALALQVGVSVIMESVLAAVVAAVIAILVALLSLPLVTAAMFSNLPMAADVDFPYETAAFGIIVAGLTGFVGGIVPAIRAARMDIANVMRA